MSSLVEMKEEIQRICEVYSNEDIVIIGEILRLEVDKCVPVPIKDGCMLTCVRSISDKRVDIHFNVKVKSTEEYFELCEEIRVGIDSLSGIERMVEYASKICKLEARLHGIRVLYCKDVLGGGCFKELILCDDKLKKVFPSTHSLYVKLLNKLLDILREMNDFTKTDEGYKIRIDGKFKYL